MITREEFELIFKEIESNWEGDNAFQGLQILSKYTDNLIQGADHDIIYSLDIDELIELGVTKEDVTKLVKLNWHISNGEYLSCFV